RLIGKHDRIRTAPVVTNSLTKVYGVSGLRCGWILAEPELAWSMYRLNDLFGSIPSHPGNLIALCVLKHLDLVRDRARKVVEADRALFHALLDQQPELVTPRTSHGTTAFVRLASGGTAEFVERASSGVRNFRGPGALLRLPGSLPRRDGCEYGDVPGGIAADRRPARPVSSRVKLR
ncbi:MAG: aminotransferase class I/II-fold pyridoxal phosphate-dependent enzyme, partial [Paludibaculum sp.]